jgi:hypothetical protein
VTNDDMPTEGVWAEQWTNPATGTKRRAAGWLLQIVSLLHGIAADVKAIRALLEKKG